MYLQVFRRGVFFCLVLLFDSLTAKFVEHKVKFNEANRCL